MVAFNYNPFCPKKKAVMRKPDIDSGSRKFLQERIAHWDSVSRKKTKPRRVGKFYHRLLKHYYKFFVPPGLRILELGCSHGDLLAALQPAFGVGVDFSGEMIRHAARKYPALFFVRGDAHELAFRQQFDVIILSDLVNDVWDVQRIFENLHTFAHPGTRLILNFYNNLWRLPLAVVKFLGVGADVLAQNWLSPQDVFNLLELSDFQVIHHRPAVLLPVSIPLLSVFANRYLVNFPPFSWFALANLAVARPRPASGTGSLGEAPSVSVIVPARNEASNIEGLLRRVPEFGSRTEIVFVEGGSEDDTYATIEALIHRFPDKECRLYRQSGKGKGDAVRLGFAKAEGDVLIILDADMTVAPEDLSRFFGVIASGKGEFINGVRLVYPLENQAMRFFNILGNKFFSLAFSWLLGQPIKDTLCGTKVLWKKDYDLIAKNRGYFGEFDPFGDFDLLFGATKLNLKIAEMPIRYRSRTYGASNIDRWRQGWLLFKMVLFAAKRIKFI